MKKRGNVLRDTNAGPGLLFVEGQQYPFTLEGLWKSATAPKPNMAVEVEFGEGNTILSIQSIEESQVSRSFDQSTASGPSFTKDAVSGKCPKCGNTVSIEHVFCQNCGHRVKEDANSSNNKRIESENVGVITQDSRNLALMTWIGTIFFNFIPGLMFYLIKKDDPYIQDQAKEALNWSITAMIGYFAGVILTFILIGIFVLIAIGICHVVFCIMGAISASNGKTFRVPFAIRLIK